MIDRDAIPVKYITGSYRYEPSYPAPEDLLWEIVSAGKKTVPADVSGGSPELLAKLESEGYIKIKNDKITVIKTPWDGTCDKQ